MSISQDIREITKNRRQSQNTMLYSLVGIEDQDKREENSTAVCKRKNKRKKWLTLHARLKRY